MASTIVGSVPLQATAPPQLEFTQQWRDQHVYSWSHHSPQWTDDDPPTANNPLFEATSADSLALCATCGNSKGTCVCAYCAVCMGGVRMGTRHHCRKCWRPVCGDCRTRTRYLNAMAATYTNVPFCDKCAVYRGIPNLTDDVNYVGIYLLREASDMPLQCVGRSCKSLTYRRTCPSCSLPTVPNAAHHERLVRLDLCCRWSAKCPKCSNAEQRIALEERRHREERLDVFHSLTLAMIDEALDVDHRQFENVFTGCDAAMTQKILLASLCSSVCYEYGAYPHTTLAMSDMKYAKLVILRETMQLYSVFEGPNKTLYIAFPGTHDLRTVVTDVRFSRVKLTEWGNVNHGLTAGGRVVHGGTHPLWEYKVHAGFQEEEEKLRHAFPTSVCREYIAQGYKIVFCGHSLGGALAMLVTIRHLTEDQATFQNNVTCVTLGSPLVGNSALTRRVQRSGWTDYFHNLVYRADIVPRLLTGRRLHREAISGVKETVVQAAVAVRSLFQGKKSAAVSTSATSGSLNDDTAGLVVDPAMIEEAFADDPAAQADTSPSANDGDLLLGDKRPFDVFGRYHFLLRDAPYSSSTTPAENFLELKRGCGRGDMLADHLLASYNRSIALRLTK